MLRVGIIGAGGYTGAELVRLIDAHPELELTFVAARERAGKRLGEVLPNLAGAPALSRLVLETFEPSNATQLRDRIDIAFLALPHGASALAAKALHQAGLRVVDLSADLRFQSLSTYRAAYGEHPAPELLKSAVYGQPELHRDELKDARLIAVPGCHVTAAILPLAPLLRAQLIETDGIVIDSKTGVSGGGRTPKAAFHYPESAEGTRPYALSGHRHRPEIEQELSRAAGTELSVTFAPILVPMTRGILSMTYARAKQGVSAEQCREAAETLYPTTGLVAVLGPDQVPDTLGVRGSACALLGYVLDDRCHTVIAIGAIDNLTRGAAAQAVQALNVSLGFPEALGLPRVGLFP